MTLIILQIIKTGLFSSTDNSLKDAASSVDTYVDMAMQRSYFLEKTDDVFIVGSEPSMEKPHDKMVNVDVLLYDKSGNLFGTADAYSKFSSVKLKKNQLNQVISGDTETIYGQTEDYHAITVEVSNDSYPDVKYATFLVSVKQIKESAERSCNIIITVMVVFWILSIGASMYLAYWSRKPILESYEKQKAFVENASHELRTPLAVLQNRLESLFRKPESTVLDNSESIASSLEEVRNMRILTTNLLNLARRDDGLKVDISEINTQYFSDIFDNYALIAEEAEKSFTYQNKLTRPIKSDKVLLKQAMTILFDNAIKYTGLDGQIAIEVRNTEKHLFIKVSDNGYGISDDDKRKIFDRFYRVDKARTRQKGGFGLGLSLAKQIIDTLGGKITVKDNQPKGSIFEIRL